MLKVINLYNLLEVFKIFVYDYLVFFYYISILLIKKPFFTCYNTLFNH
jgi:hypothetical protein